MELEKRNRLYRSLIRKHEHRKRWCEIKEINEREYNRFNPLIYSPCSSLCLVIGEHINTSNSNTIKLFYSINNKSREINTLYVDLDNNLVSPEALGILEMGNCEIVEIENKQQSKKK